MKKSAAARGDWTSRGAVLENCQGGGYPFGFLWGQGHRFGLEATQIDEGANPIEFEGREALRIA